MNIAIISFTSSGRDLSKRITPYFEQLKDNYILYTMPSYVNEPLFLPLEISLTEWVKDNFFLKDAIIFVGAVGIAVRGIAPFIKSKQTDPAIIVIDEKGNYVIPLLSGHIGGANKLAEKLASFLHANAVITTATDLNNKFSVDTFAAKNKLVLSDIKIAKKISTKLLQGKKVELFSEIKLEGRIPKDLVIISNPMLFSKNTESIFISIYQISEKIEGTLHLIPKRVAIGIGCRKGIPSKTIEEVVMYILHYHNLSNNSILGIFSIDLKQGENGLIQFCKNWNLPFSCYSAQQLLQTKGNFTSSSFVESITNVDNICERAAVRGSENGTLIQKKFAKSGITVALALKEETILF